jgi:hypothetical protein
MNSQEREERLQEIIAGYLEAEESGEPPERGEFLARYPEWQAELELFLSNRDKLAHAFGKLGGLETPSLPATLSSASARHEAVAPVGVLCPEHHDRSHSASDCAENELNIWFLGQFLQKTPQHSVA